MVVEYIKNSDISKIIVGIPKRHKHLRLLIALEDGRVFVFSEAALANMVRAYITVKTHPVKRAVELKRIDLKNDAKLKREYARIQLLETEREEDRIREELLQMIKNSTYISKANPS